MQRRFIFILSTLLSFFIYYGGILSAHPSKTPDREEITVTVLSSEGKQPVGYAVVTVPSSGLWAVTDDSGKGKISGVPSGSIVIEVSMMGYVTKSQKVEVLAGKANKFQIIIEPMTLAIDEVVVVAQNSKSGESTSSKIGRQAIDHIQATSLKDVLQLLPGQVMKENPSLTSVGQFYNRTLDKNDGNNAFGAAIMVDGVPLSNNANMNTRGGSYSTAGGGVDMRSIGTDEIESIEVIRGIASAEYGDVASGTMILTSKIGVTDLKVRSKIMPGIGQFYAGKGMSLKRFGTLNINADYAVGKSDPRYRNDTYNRLTTSAAHSITIAGKYVFTTKLNYINLTDWSGPDPSEKVQNVYDSTKENGFSISHSGKLNIDRLFMRTLKYDLSYSYKRVDSYSKMLIQGRQPLVNALEDGEYQTTMLPNEYFAGGGTNGKPLSLYAKVSDMFHLDTKNGIFQNKINIGAEYRRDGNSGEGIFNDNPMLPISSSGSRPRPFFDIPALEQIAAYAEDNITLRFSKNEYPRIKAQLGLRWTMIQPGKSDAMSSLSPRINSSFSLNKWVDFRFGFGISEKTPSLLQLYPANSYLDFLNINSTDASGRYIGYYTTRVFDHTPKDLKPMRSTKYEAGIDFRLPSGQQFSIVAFRDRIMNGFASNNSEWVALFFNRWTPIYDAAGDITFDKSSKEPVVMLQNVSRTSNMDTHISQGIEWDFNLGKINSTKTSFYLTGAYMQTEYYSNNLVYNRPRGSAANYENVYVVYSNKARSTERRQATTSLRVVQSIPRLNFVVSGTVQAVLYDYNCVNGDLTTPIGYIAPKTFDESGYVGGRGESVYTQFTADQIANGDKVFFNGHKLSDQFFEPTVYSGMPETWPSLWVINLRVTKDVTKYCGLSFQVNNLFFSQPWHKSSVSSSETERNANLFSYGFELYLNF